jgi:AraC family transcriptional activator of pobA
MDARFRFLMPEFFSTAELAGREESALNLDFWKVLNQAGGGMGRVSHRPSGGTGVPVFELFGERQTWPTPDLLHCESIPERSRVHDWEITQHRHADLGQFVYVQAGHAVLDVEGSVTEIDEPAMQIVPPMCVHGFRFSRDIAGYVITLALPLFDWLQDSLGDAAPALLRADCYAVGADKPYLDQLCQRIDREYATVAPGRDFALHSLVGALGSWVGRQQHEQREAEWRPDRGQQRTGSFSRLVEQHFREHWSVAQYAAELAITTAQLNNVCHRSLGCTALEHVHHRVLLEAKRNLIYTTMTVAQIADLLGFSDVGYFSRFFRRLERVSPRDFRQQQASYGRTPA